MLLLLVLLGSVAHLSQAIKCHTCVDNEFNNYLKYVPETSSKAVKKLPLCTQSETFNCHFGCMEFKATEAGKQYRFRDCVSTDMVSKMKPNGTNELPPRMKDGVTINGYMCTLDFCNKEYEQEPVASFFTIPAVAIAASVMLLAAVIAVVIVCTVRKPQYTPVQA